MKSREYFASLQGAVLAVPSVIQSKLSFDEVSEIECYISGILILDGGFELHVAEYMVSEPKLVRLKYRYHLQTSEGNLIARWDNAAHHPEVSAHPDHLHTKDNQIKPAEAMDIWKIMEEALSLIG